MEKRDQRVRRDRRRDGKRNTFQKEQEKEPIKQQDSVVDAKKNDGQNVETSNEKNKAKDKTIEVPDDPLRFANLKRETDEIAALKAKKPLKRQVFSNWSKYEEPLPSQDESQAVDFETLLHAPQSGSFRFKSEQQWDTGSFGQFGELFTPDADLLVGGLTALPFYKRLGIDKTLFLEEEIEKMESCAKANFLEYEKLIKSKPKPKIAATDLFKVDQAEKYSVVDQANGPAVEVSKSKPVFSVEESTEVPSVELPNTKLPAPAVVSNFQQSVSSRESTPAREHTPEAVTRDFHFEKPPPSSYGSSGNQRSLFPSRESTPAADSRPGAPSKDFHFERAPPPSYTPGSLQSPFHSRENTPAKETVSTAANRGFISAKPQVPVSHSGSDRQLTGRESTPDSATRTEPEKEPPQKMPGSHPTATAFTSPVGVPSEDVSSKEKTLAREQLSTEPLHHENSVEREASPVQKVTESHLSVTVFASQEVKSSHNRVPSKVETPMAKEPSRESVPQRGGAVARGEPMDHDLEQKTVENGHIATENYSSSKKKGKPENQQRGGGRHGRRKKGHHASAQDGEQYQVEAREMPCDTAQPEADGAATRADSPVAEQDTHPAVELKEKPERPPPPVILQQKQSPPPAPQPSSPPTVPKHENKAQQPVASKPEEPQPQHLEVAAALDRQVQPPQRKTVPTVKAEPVLKEPKPAVRQEDDSLSFLMSLRGQKGGTVSEVEAAKSAASITVSRSAIEEDELKESQKSKPPPMIVTEKKEDLEDWLDSMLDD